MKVNSTNKKQARSETESFLEGFQALVPPAVWKQANAARCLVREPPRWATHPLILTLLVMTWCSGDSQAERFDTAKEFTAACLNKRRRPGESVQGFQKALAKLPTRVLRVVAAGVRGQLLKLLDLKSDGFYVFGCDGSSMETPRTAELEKRLDAPLKKEARPQVWVTALVHLRTGVLWSWRLGKGYNREREHLRHLLPSLPPSSLVVADAGYNGYGLAQQMIKAGVSFLIRMSGKDRLYTKKRVRLRKFKEGIVFLWPLEARRKKLPPLRVRLIRIKGKGEQKGRDVWLLTNVFDSQRLPASMAGRYYRWRWENEGLFRTFKRTLAKVRLMGHTVREVHREAEGALLATQLLLAQGARAMPSRSTQKAPRRCSPRKVLLAIRQVILGRIGIRKKGAFQKLLAKALREERVRKSSKVSRSWPCRVKHRPPKQPHFLMLTAEQKTLMDKLLSMAA